MAFFTRLWIWWPVTLCITKSRRCFEGFDFEAPTKSITEGDISVTFAGASDGAQSAEARFDALLATLMHPAESTLAAYRRMRW